MDFIIEEIKRVADEMDKAKNNRDFDDVTSKLSDLIDEMRVLVEKLNDKLTEIYYNR